VAANYNIPTFLIGIRIKKFFCKISLSAVRNLNAELLFKKTRKEECLSNLPFFQNKKLIKVCLR
jgi:hypothetical protein